MAKSPASKSYKPWTDEEAASLRRLAEAGMPRSEIARQIGRSPDAVANYASKIGVKLAHPGSALPARPEASPLSGVGDDLPEPARGEGRRAPDEGKPPARFPSLASGAAEPERRLKVVRLDRSALPWIWEIRHDGAAHPLARSGRGFRSAEDAWTAGKSALTDVGRRGDMER